MAKYLEPNVAALEAGYDLDNESDYMSLMLFASVVPACCSEGCMVEPDGTCQHGFSSVVEALMF